MVSKQQESAQFLKIQSCQVTFVWRLECAYHCLKVPRATIRKPACVECLYSEPRLLGVHPQDKFLGTPLVILPASELQTQQLITPQIRSHTEYLLQAYNILLLILYSKFFDKI